MLINYQDLFQCLKGVGRLDLSGFMLPVHGTKYALRPINCSGNKIDEHIIEMLTIARNTNLNSFLAFFNATTVRTRNWLLNSVAPDSARILFVLQHLDTGSLYGYMGLAYGDHAATRIEGDAIVRYAEQREPGLMRAAFVQLVEWVVRDLGVSQVWVRVLSDNPAVDFYKACSFSPISEAPLFKKYNPQDDAHVLTERQDENTKPAHRSIVYMKYVMD